MSVPWDTTFDELLRGYLGLLGDGAALPPDAYLADLGLDSLSVVNLLIDLEDAYEVSLPDELLTPATFATAGALWGVLTDLRANR